MNDLINAAILHCPVDSTEHALIAGESPAVIFAKSSSKLGGHAMAVNRLAVYVTVKGDMQMALARLVALALTFVQPKESDS